MSSAGTGGGPLSPSRPGPVGGISVGGLAVANVVSSSQARGSPANLHACQKSFQASNLRQSVGAGMEVREIPDILQKLTPRSQVRRSPEPELFPLVRGLIERPVRSRAVLS